MQCQPSLAFCCSICIDSDTAKSNLCSLEPKASFNHFFGAAS
ncbi:Unknown protein sequence [Pseudomonas amygdali pv. lachrymans]|nr:Unknown protein sequence [Pseudomonas amygdali pv. lachrymans]